MITDREKLLHLIFNEKIRESDAIVLLEGDGTSRVNHTIELFQAGFAPRIIFSGGVLDYNYGSFPYEDIKPLLIKGGIPENAIIHENKSMHTKEQAIEVISLSKKECWEKLILVASPHHQMRAYLTFLSEVIPSKDKIILYNSSAKDALWFENNNWGKRIDLLYNEFDRIEQYTKIGHLASIADAIKYQKWKEEQN